MAARLWLALALLQLATAAPSSPGGAGVGIAAEARDVIDFDAIFGNLVKRQATEDWSEYGTWKKSSPLIGTTSSDKRTAADFQKALTDPNAQPATPTGGNCTYGYANSYPSPALTIWDSGTSPVSDLDVHQGGIGDCGIGAAVASVAANGYAHILKDRLSISGHSYTFTLSWKGVDHKVVVDDKLPILVSGPEHCSDLLGFRPSGPNNSSYVSLLEKAIAKLTDAYPELKKEATLPNGYKGLDGFWPEYALEIITGKKHNCVTRAKPGLDPIILNALKKCLTDPQPCIIGTRDTAFGDEILGPHDPDGSWAVPYGENYISAVISVSNDKNKFWHSVDHDDNERINTLVTDHAYALDKTHSTYTAGGDIRKAKVRLLNPWGANPGPWQKMDTADAIELSLPDLASITTSVFSVDSI